MIASSFRGHHGQPDDYVYNKIVERRSAPFDLRRVNPTVSDTFSGFSHLFAFEFYIPVLLRTLLFRKRHHRMGGP